MRGPLRLAALAATLLVSLASASASASAACRPGHVVERSHKAVVYWRTEPAPYAQNPDVRAYYGCAFSTGKARRLKRVTEYDGIHDLTLAGRYVAFVSYFEEGAAAEVVEQIRVWDLRDGRHRRIRPLSAGERLDGRSEYVSALVLKPTGTFAWIAAFSENEGVGTPGGVTDPTYQVNADETWNGGKRRKLDQSTAVQRRSLGLSEDGKFLYWMHGKSARSARIR